MTKVDQKEHYRLKKRIEPDQKDRTRSERPSPAGETEVDPKISNLIRNINFDKNDQTRYQIPNSIRMTKFNENTKLDQQDKLEVIKSDHKDQIRLRQGHSRFSIR